MIYLNIAHLYYLYIVVPFPFSRQHPLALWVSSMLMCFASQIWLCLLFNTPLATVLNNPDNILIASAVWWVYRIWDNSFPVWSCLFDVTRCAAAHRRISYYRFFFTGCIRYHVANEPPVWRGFVSHFLNLKQNLCLQNNLWNLNLWYSSKLLKNLLKSA